MNWNPKTLRRGGGAICLLAAGETVLDGKLAPFAFLLYWLGCTTLTGLAIVAAVADVRAVRREMRDEQRALIEATLKNARPEATPESQR